MTLNKPQTGLTSDNNPPLNDKILSFNDRGETTQIRKNSLKYFNVHLNIILRNYL